MVENILCVENDVRMVADCNDLVCVMALLNIFCFVKRAKSRNEKREFSKRVIDPCCMGTTSFVYNQ